jgi:SPP1 gp7 family putative phage head morphogenesis protein
MKISATLRRDPTMTKRIIASYENELVEVFSHIRGDLRMAVESSRQLAEMVNIDVASAKDKINVILNNVVLSNVSTKARKHVVTVQMMATMRVDQLLKASGIDPASGFTPAEKLLRDLLVERNIGALKGLTDDMGKNIIKELTDGIMKGEGIDALTKRIDSISDMGVERARLIARTETLYAYNATARDRYKRNGIEMVEWLAALDDRVCDQCGPLDGERFTLGTEPDCPLHPNCRCTLIPAFKEAA